MSDIRNTFDEAVNTLESLGAKAAAGAKNLMDKAKPAIEVGSKKAAEGVREFAEKVGPTVESAYEKAKPGVEEMWNKAVDGAKELAQKAKPAIQNAIDGVQGAFAPKAAEGDAEKRAEDALASIQREAEERFEEIRNFKTADTSISDFIHGRTAPDDDVEEPDIEEISD